MRPKWLANAGASDGRGKDVFRDDRTGSGKQERNLKMGHVNISGKPVFVAQNDPTPGDILLFPLGAGFCFGIVDSWSGRGTLVRWDDFALTVTPSTGYFANRRALLPTTGSLVGKWFHSLDLAYLELCKHRKFPAIAPARAQGVGK